MPFRLLGGRLAMLFGLTGLAISQPLLNSLSTSPETFVFNHFDAFEIVTFALILAFGVPLVLWLVESAAYGVNESAGRWMHLIFCGGLFAVFVQQLLVEMGMEGTPFAVLISLAAGIALPVAITRYEVISKWVMLTSILPFVAVALFLFSSPVSDLVRPSSVAAVETAATDDPPSSVILIVLDEFPTQSMITADEQVDAARFPNLAEFAKDATWYRHYTSISPYTKSAVPSILTGMEPVGGVDWSSFENNIFRLLGDSHHLTVSEPITTLCSVEGCGEQPIAPPSASGVVAPEPETPSADFGQMFKATRGLFRERLLPSDPDAGNFDSFEEEFEPVKATTATSTPRGQSESIDELATPLATGEPDQALQQPVRFNEFVDSLVRSDDPTFYFLHLLLPHQPWRFDEHSKEYSAPGILEPGRRIEGDWLARLSRQRHLLQGTYTDGLVGKILAKAKAEGIYDDALIVVVADHGIKFGDGQHTRLFDVNTISSLSYVPLFVKPPGETKGRIDDANVWSIDVLPTMAAHLGVQIPWAVDGVDANGVDISKRGGAKQFNELDKNGLKSVAEFDDPEMYAEMLGAIFPSITSSDDHRLSLWKTIEGGEELIGTRVDDLDLEDSRVKLEIVDLDSLTRQQDSAKPAPGIVTGWIDQEASVDEDDLLVAIALDGAVVSLSEIQARNERDGWFATLLPSGSSPPIDLEIFLIDPESGQSWATELIAE